MSQWISSSALYHFCYITILYDIYCVSRLVFTWNWWKDYSTSVSGKLLCCPLQERLSSSSGSIPRWEDRRAMKGRRRREVYVLIISNQINATWSKKGWSIPPERSGGNERHVKTTSHVFSLREVPSPNEMSGETWSKRRSNKWECCYFITLSLCT